MQAFFDCSPLCTSIRYLAQTIKQSVVPHYTVNAMRLWTKYIQFLYLQVLLQRSIQRPYSTKCVLNNKCINISDLLCDFEQVTYLEHYFLHDQHENIELKCHESGFQFQLYKIKLVIMFIDMQENATNFKVTMTE